MWVFPNADPSIHYSHFVNNNFEEYGFISIHSNQKFR